MLYVAERLLGVLVLSSSTLKESTNVVVVDMNGDVMSIVGQNVGRFILIFVMRSTKNRTLMTTTII